MTFLRILIVVFVIKLAPSVVYPTNFEYSNAILVFSLPSEIRVMSMDGLEKEHKLTQKEGVINGMTFNARDDFVYWTDGTIGKERILRSKLDGTEVEVVINTGVVQPGPVAYDWIGKNLYFIDLGTSKIIMCPENGETCSILLTISSRNTLSKNLALDPNRGYLYFTQIRNPYSGHTQSNDDAIRKAKMDGSDPSYEKIIRYAGNIAGIAVDHSNGDIYWVDTSDRISTKTFDGYNSRLIRSGASGSRRQPSAIEIFGDSVYWADRNMHDIRACSKIDGSNLRTILKDSNEEFNGLLIFHISNQPTSRTNPCESANCSHICAIGPSNYFKCGCPVGMKLAKEDDPDWTKLLIANTNKLKTMNLCAIGRNVFDEFELNGVDTIGALAHNPVTNVIYLSELSGKKIYQFNLKSKSLTVLLEGGLNSITAMDIDIVGENLYWVDSVQQTVEVMSLRTKSRAVLFKDYGEPLHIAVAPDSKCYILVSRLLSGIVEIVKMSLRGRNRLVLHHDFGGVFSNINLQRPGINFGEQSGDWGNIFWTNAQAGTIQYIPFNYGGKPYIFMENIKFPSGITSIGKTIYWTESTTNTLSSESFKEKGQTNRPIYFGQYYRTRSSTILVKNATELQGNVKLVVLSTEIQFLSELRNHHQCSILAPERINCSHTCLLSENDMRGVCICPQGFELSKNGQTCKLGNGSNMAATPVGCTDGNCKPEDYNLTFTASSEAPLSSGEFKYVIDISTKAEKSTKIVIFPTMSGYTELTSFQRNGEKKIQEVEDPFNKGLLMKILTALENNKSTRPAKKSSEFMIAIGFLHFLGFLCVVVGLVWMYRNYNLKDNGGTRPEIVDLVDLN